MTSWRYITPKNVAEGFTIVVADTEQAEGLSSARAMEALRGVAVSGRNLSPNRPYGIE
jgi:hypothetical protein